MTACRTIICALLLAANAYAAEPRTDLSLDDFAIGYRLNSVSSSPIYQAVFPEEIYRVSQKNDYSDLRVFNAQAEVVPHALVRPSPVHEATKRSSLPFFPLHGVDSKNRESLSVKVSRDQHGTIVNINNEAAMANNQPVTAYVIDASQIATPLTKLHVRWGKTDSFTARVSLSHSDDLNRWSTVVTSATIADLVHGSERLTRNFIEFKPTKAKYFQLSWPADAHANAIVAIEAEITPAQVEPVPSWLSLEGQQGTGDEGRTQLVFDSNGRFPIDRLNLNLSGHNSLLRTTIWSRADEKSPWQQRLTGLFYRVQPGDPNAEFRNEPMRITRTMDRYWRVDITSSDNPGSHLPKLELGWVGDRVMFLARGSGPYTLAVGAHDVGNSEQPIEQLLRMLDQKNNHIQPAVATIGERVILGGEDRLKGGPRSISWRKYILWSVLVGGVLLLAWMSVGLVRQMNRPQQGS